MQNNKTNRNNKTRYVAMGVIMALVFSVFGWRLYDLQIANQETYAAQAEEKKQKTLTLTGSRGKILDRNAVPLAYNQRSFEVQFYRDPSRSTQADREAYTQSIMEVIEIVEKNGKETIDEFWLERNEEGEWQFNTGTTNEAANETRISQWRGNFMLNSTPVEDLFDQLCINYGIPEELSEEEKIKILAIWQEIQMNAYLSKPVTIAYNVDFQTVSEIEARSMDLDGVSIAESSERVYPKGSLAAHVIGYVGKITSEEDLAAYKEKGYSNDALVGQTGIESSMEDQLSPYANNRQGEQVVEVNRRGKIVRQLSYTAPVDGDSVQLTLDSQLQAVLEQALEDNINEINKEQQKIIKSERWQKQNEDILKEYEEQGKEIQLAQSGAAVAMDPNTGEVLAMASYPSYDLGILTGTVDKQAWNEVVNDDRYPLLNRAIATRDTPGSIFKLCTALAGLMEGVITPETEIYDATTYEGTDVVHPPRCWSLNRSHGNQNVVEAIKNSCNYFFYWTGERLGSTALSKWAAKLGLTSRTGIELPGEATSFVGNQSMLYDASRAIDDQYTSKPLYAARMIKQKLKEIGQDRGIEYDDDRLDRVTKSMLDIVVTTESKSEWAAKIHDILLADMNLPIEYIRSNYLANTFQSYLNDLKWTANETIMAAIGQSITQITPIAAARYVSAVVNGGTVYDAQIVDKVISPDGDIVLDKQPSVVTQIEGADEYFELIREGMRDVTSTEYDGTAAKYYANTKYPMGAKTGTSQRTELDIENNSWHVAFGPYDDPQIVVVVYIQNGYAGGRSSPTAITTITSYLDSLAEEEDTKISKANTLAD
ncbi:MAG TPA: hypothetical protein IAA59_01305 [Candidatus Faecaligallichristensenella faecipullorum]|nr:hypothetical protein [Candidatus Faecaligallichristensenella faecipullorum]